jgi:hypothetical protein
MTRRHRPCVDTHQRPVHPSHGDPAMPNVFSVIGENRDDPDHLLMLGSDGQHYDYRVTDGTTTPTDPAAAPDDWAVDPDLPPFEDLLG